MYDAFVVKLVNFGQAGGDCCSRLMILTWHLPWQHLINTHSSDRSMCIYACQGVCFYLSVCVCKCMCVCVKRLKRNRSGNRRLVPGCVKRCHAMRGQVLCLETVTAHTHTRRDTQANTHRAAHEMLQETDTHTHTDIHTHIVISQSQSN